MEKWETALRVAFSEKETQVVDIDIETPKGMRHYTSRIVPEFTPKNEVGTVLSITRDITERKEAEDLLRLQAMVLDQIADRVTVTDLEGRITYVNEAETEALGYGYDELIGAFTGKFGEYPERSASQAEVIEQTLRTGSWHGEIVNRTADGRGVVVDCRTQVVHDIQGNRIALCGIATDITERKQAEAEREKLQAQLVQAQKMESIGRLAGGVAHDFNNKLQVILGQIEVALMDLDSGDPLVEGLLEIRQAAQFSADLTRQLLAFASKQVIAPRVLDLNETVESILKMLRRLVGENIDLSWQPDGDLWPVKVDAAQVDQVLANLSVNARDAGAHRIVLKTSNVQVDAAYCANRAGLGAGDYVALTVRDDGCGMDAQTQGRIYEPFFTTKPVGKGTGLGLPSVYGIIKQNNGYIEVQSAPGQGTAFLIYLPRHTEQQGDLTERPERPGIIQGRGETLLLVEDEAPLLNMTQKSLGRIGYTVLGAASAEAALALAASHEGQIDMLITDVIMPGMNGRELARDLSREYPDMKCLFVSGYTANEIHQYGALEEGVHFLEKPFSIAALTAMVREVLDER